MAKTRVKEIDDSKPTEEEQKKPRLSRVKKTDSLVESLKSELAEEFGESPEIATSPKAPRDDKKSVTASEARPAASAKRGEQSKPGKVRHRSKRYQEAISQVDKSQSYKIQEAVELAQKSSYSKFPGTVEVHINTISKNLRGLATMPYGSGKKLRILAFGPSTGSASSPQTSSGQVNLGEDVMLGNESTIDEINQGKINFDVLVTTPDWMPKLAKVARILGPRSLMPNPKSGTITENLEKTVTELQAGKVEYKTEANGQVIHLAVGKVNQEPNEVVANIKSLFMTIGKSRIKKITLASTMGPGVKVDLASL